mgnify:CR=1 FL=1
MSKYNLEEIHNNNLKEAMSADDQARFDQLTKDDQLKLEKIFAMMKAEKDAKKSTNEDFDSVVDKIKDSGKSEEDAKKIAGAINAKYVGNYREGVEENGQVDDYTEEIAEENDEDKLPMDEARIDRDVAERIEGMLSIPLKRKFLDSFMDLWQDLIEEDPFYAEDVINHLNNEMHREIDGYQAMGDKLAGMEENHAMQGVEAELESGEIGNMDALTEEIGPTGIAITDKQLDSLEKLGAIAGLEVYVQDKDGSNVRKVDYTLTNTNFEKDPDDIDDAGIREHFGRFLKDYQ